MANELYYKGGDAADGKQPVVQAVKTIDDVLSKSSQGQAEAGTDDNTIMTPLRVAQSIEANPNSAVAANTENLGWVLDQYEHPVIGYQTIQAEVNSSGSATPIPLGGTTATSYVLSTGALPSGFSFDTETGIISWTVGGTAIPATTIGVTPSNPTGDGNEFTFQVSVVELNGATQYTNDEDLFVGVRITTSNSVHSQVLIKQDFHGRTTSTSNGVLIEDSSSPIWVGDNGNGTWNYFLQPTGYSYWNIFLNSTTDPSTLANGASSDITTSLTYDLVAPNSQDVVYDGVNYPSDATDVHYITQLHYLRIGNESSLNGVLGGNSGSWSYGFRLQRDWKLDGLGRALFEREGRNWQGVTLGHNSTYQYLQYGNGSSQSYDSSESSTIPSIGFASGSYVRITFNGSTWKMYVNGTLYYSSSLLYIYLDNASSSDSLDLVFGKCAISNNVFETNYNYMLSFWQGQIDRLWVSAGTEVLTDDNGTTYPTGTTHSWDMSETTGNTFAPSTGSVTMYGDKFSF